MRSPLKTIRFLLAAFGSFQAGHASSALASDLKVGDPAPAFSTQTHEGAPFDLNSRAGKWTILYFYPKADTPGCTKQACAFRDGLKKITALGAEVFGISADTVEAQKAFHKKHALNFTLLADADGNVVEQFGTKMPMLKLSKRWTFVIDPDLKIRAIEKDVDPVLDAPRMAEQLAKLGAKPTAAPTKPQG